MFNKSGPCRLCLKLLKCDQTLYDEHGRRTNVYELVAKYITPELLDMECAKHVQSICMKCWRFIYEFHTFQQCVLLNQRKLAGICSQVEFPTNYGIRTTAISTSAGSQVVVEESGETRNDARYDPGSPIAEQHRSNIPAEGFDCEESITVDSTLSQTAAISSSGGLDSCTDDRNNLECVSGQEDALVVKSEVCAEPQLTEVYNQPDTAILPGGSNSSIVLSTLISSAISTVLRDKNVAAFGLGEQSKAEIQSILLPAVQAIAIGADDTINPIASCDESSNESHHINEECDEFDDPVGTFIGGEFGNSISDAGELQSEDRSSQPEGCESDSYSSNDDMPLSHYLLSGKRPFNAEDQEKDNQTPKPNFTTSKSEQGISKGNNRRRHKTAEEFDVSESQDSDTDFSVSNENSTSNEPKSKGNQAIPQQQNPTEINQADTNQRTSNFKHTPKDSQNKRPHKTALEFYDSESAESVVSNDGASHSEDELYVDSRSKLKIRYRGRRSKFSYLSNVKQLQTVQEYDDFIAKWRPKLECVVCKETCSKFSLLLEHFNDQHPTEECYIWCCQEKFYQRCEIEKHIHYHNEPAAFKCEICYKCYTTADMLRNHLSNKHAGKPPDPIFKCPQCSKSFTMRQTLERHLKHSCDKDQKKKERIYSCDKCDKSYKSNKVLKRHYRAKHTSTGEKREIIKCSICDKVCQSHDVLDQHMDKHRGERNKVCPWCPQSYFYRSMLLIHCKRDHPKEFEERRRQQDEQRKIKKTYKCSDCDKVYQTRLAFMEHQASHNGNKAQYRCKYCPKEYKYSSNLAAHAKRVHPK